MSDAPASPPAPARRRIRAQGSATDPETMGFVLDAEVPEGVAAPLGALAGVARVEVAGATVWVRRAPGADWAALKPAVAAALRAALDAATPPEPADPDAGPDADADAALLAEVAALLERQVNPAVAAHGGHIAAERVADRRVFLRMSGGCQGCAASAATLRQGVERMLRAALPAIREIVDVTDHAAGSTPFYARDAGASPMPARPALTRPVLNRPVPRHVIGWEDGQVIVDPDWLAPRLGLTPETLREGLRAGSVTGVTETGTGADAGMTRIVMRSPTRAWAAEIAPDGSAREIPPPRLIPARGDQADAAAPAPDGAADDLPARVRAHLEALPAEAEPVTYGALARALGFWAPGSVRRITAALEATMREDAAAGRPFIAARTVSRAGVGLPGRGFFDTARALGRGPREGAGDGQGDGDWEAAFLARERARLAEMAGVRDRGSAAR